MADELSELYASFLDGTYDCVDRIVLNAYCGFANSPGGFRTWWRNLHGSDEHLDNAHLMRLAGRFSRRIHAFAKQHGIPLEHCASRERKHLVAEKYRPSDPDARGVFLILVAKAPAPVWDIQRYGRGGINIHHKESRSYVNHYYFHIMDPEWGHVTIRMCGQPPFNAQIILNGHIQ